MIPLPALLLAAGAAATCSPPLEDARPPEVPELAQLCPGECGDAFLAYAAVDASGVAQAKARLALDSKRWRLLKTRYSRFLSACADAETTEKLSEQLVVLKHMGADGSMPREGALVKQAEDNARARLRALNPELARALADIELQAHQAAYGSALRQGGARAVDVAGSSGWAAAGPAPGAREAIPRPVGGAAHDAPRRPADKTVPAAPQQVEEPQPRRPTGALAWLRAAFFTNLGDVLKKSWREGSVPARDQNVQAP